MNRGEEQEESSFPFNKSLSVRNWGDFSARPALTGYQEHVNAWRSSASEFASRASPLPPERDRAM